MGTLPLQSDGEAKTTEASSVSEGIRTEVPLPRSARTPEAHE